MKPLDTHHPPEHQYRQHKHPHNLQCLPRRTMSPATPQKLFRNDPMWQEPKVLIRSPNYPDPKLTIICGMCKNKFDPWRPNSPTVRTRRIHCQLPNARHHMGTQEVFCLCLDVSELFWWHKVNKFPVYVVCFFFNLFFLYINRQGWSFEIVYFSLLYLKLLFILFSHCSQTTKKPVKQDLDCKYT